MWQQGVTLIQMMIALTLLGALAQLGVPAYASLTSDLYQAAAARDLAQILRTARSHALLQNQAVLVQPLQEDWGLGWRMLLAHNRQVLREQRLVRPLKIVANLEEVKFSELGMPVQDNGAFLAGTLQICQRSEGASQHHVVLARSGRISLRTVPMSESRCASP